MIISFFVKRCDDILVRLGAKMGQRNTHTGARYDVTLNSEANYKQRLNNLHFYGYYIFSDNSAAIYMHLLHATLFVNKFKYFLV